MNPTGTFRVHLITQSMAIVVALSAVILGLFPIVRLLAVLITSGSSMYVDQTIRAFGLSAALALITFCAQCAIALSVGEALAEHSSRTVLLIFAAPLCFGPTVCALLWKPLLNPGNSLLAYLSSAVWTQPFDWSTTRYGPFFIVAVIQVWTWGAVLSAVLAGLSGSDTRQAQMLYLLDGGRPRLAFISALRATRGKWLALLGLLLIVENLRAFETIYIFGVPGERDATLAYLVFQGGYLSIDRLEEATSAMALILLNALLTIMFSFFWRRWNKSYA